MRSPALILTCTVIMGCVHAHSSGEPQTKSSVVVVRRPIIIGFFPAVGATLGPDLTAPDQSGLLSAMDHFTWALDNVRACLESKGVLVREVYADQLVVRNRRVVERLELSEGDNDSIGCYIVAPGRSPAVVRATQGASSLVLACQVQAAVYFSIPECCPEGVTCCLDGSYRLDKTGCDG